MKKILSLFAILIFLSFSANNVSLAAVPELTIGKKETFSIQANRENRHIIEITEPSNVTITITSDMPSVGYSFTNNKLQVVQNGFVNSTNISSGKETLNHDLMPGKFELRMKSSSDGDYTILVETTAIATNENEPNNNNSQAQLITSGQSINGFIAWNDPSDVYQFTIDKESKMNLQIDGHLSKTTWYQVTNKSNKTLLNKYAESSKTSPAKINETIYLNPGTYYVKVYGNETNNTGTYTLQVTINEVITNEKEPNNITSFAQKIQIGDKINGFISEGDKNDIFEINIPTFGTYTLQIHGSMTEGTPVRIADSTTNKYIFSKVYSSTAGNPAIVNEELKLDPGKYYIEFYNQKNSYGEYSFTVVDGTVGAVGSITTFADFEPGAYWVESFTWGMNNGIIKGDSQTNRLNPYQSITEGQWLAMLLRYAVDAKDSTTGNWFDSYYAIAKEEGIHVNNKPYQPLRRGDVAKMLVKVYTGESLSEKDAVNWLIANKITTSKNYDDFNPNDELRRAQAISFMYRLNQEGITPKLGE